MTRLWKLVRHSMSKLRELHGVSERVLETGPMYYDDRAIEQLALIDRVRLLERQAALDKAQIVMLAMSVDALISALESITAWREEQLAP